MAMDYVSIGCVPAGEDCEQLGPNYNPAKARQECNIFKRQLEREFPEVYFKVKSFPHDFGTYMEVVAMFDEDDEEQCEKAFEAENNTPEFWDDEAKKEIEALTNQVA